MATPAVASATETEPRETNANASVSNGSSSNPVNHTHDSPNDNNTETNATTACTSTTEANTIPNESKQSEFTKTVTVAEAVRDLVNDVKNSEREHQINRILSSHKINPVDILQISLDLDEANIKKQYRTLSLMVHPDRCDDTLKERAQRAFTMLNNCKKDLESKDFVIKLKHQINEARRRVVERKMIQKGQAFVSSEPAVKKQRTDDTLDVSNAKPPLMDEEAPSEDEIKVQLREILVDCAWQKHIQDQASQKLEQQTLARREELKARIAAEKQYKKEWEEGREERVSSWRDWQNLDKKKKKKKKKKNKLGM